MYAVPTAPSPASPSAEGFEFRSADDAWRTDPEAFRRETFDDPRLGLIGVLPEYRRRGLARALVARVLGIMHERGDTEVVRCRSA